MKATLLTLIALLGLTTLAAAETPPDRATNAHIERLAYELKQTTARLHRRAAYASWFRRHRQRPVAEAMRVLDDRARRFQQQVAWGRRAPGYGRAPARGHEAYRELVWAYREAEQALRYMPARGRLHADFNRVGRLMHRLSEVYRVNGYRHGPRGRRYEPGYDAGPGHRNKPGRGRPWTR